MDFGPSRAGRVAGDIPTDLRQHRSRPRHCKPEPDRGLQTVTAEIVGRADDKAGVEVFVVRIAGSTDRPDGSTWHITWSLGEGRQAKESNDVIAEYGWSAVGPYTLHLTPAEWR